MSDDEFYVGYLPHAPPGQARFLRRVVAGLWGLAALVSLAVVLGQRPFAAAVFEFGEVREFEGTLDLFPQPMLMVERPGRRGDGDGVSSYYLVGPGKAGAGPALAAFDGDRVRLRGTLVYRDDQTMIEIDPDSLEDRGPGSLASAPVALGDVTLTGEIVDSKCFLGVMNPGNLKPHRACAARCISGGIPPILLVRRPDGAAAHLLLVGPAGEAINDRLLDVVAEPVEVTGRLERHRDRLVLRADPADIRRVAAP